MGRLPTVNRADRMLAVLSSAPRAFSRDEIFQRCGSFFLTNNAASELRARGYKVRRSTDSTGAETIYLYELVGDLPETDGDDPSVSGSSATACVGSSSSPPPAAAVQDIPCLDGGAGMTVEELLAAGVDGISFDQYRPGDEFEWVVDEDELGQLDLLSEAA